VHGNRLDLNKKVQLTAELNDTGLIVCIRDEGEGFDPESVADPLLPDHLLNESGRGLFLVKSCMDDVIMRRAGSCGMEITLIKRITKQPLLKRKLWGR
jgi:serine/threonine-protein kinase RsbW